MNQVFNEDRHRRSPSTTPTHVIEEWRMKKKLKTTNAVLVICLNLGVDPPDQVKADQHPTMFCWIDPSTKQHHPATLIGAALKKQYERLQPRARYKQCLDPTLEIVKKACETLRRQAKRERVLFHYNGSGVPRVSRNGEIWLFNKNFTQYIPLSVYDLHSWMRTPAIYVFDCSYAGLVVEPLLRVFDGERERNPRISDNIILGATRKNETLPSNPEFPADVFTCCLTTPIKMSLKWFCMKKELLGHIPEQVIMEIPGRLSDRRTAKGELNWIFTAIMDTIAWDVLPRPLFRKLFRQDLLVASLFRNFLLADRILRHSGVRPVSFPVLPETFFHPLWKSWDLALDVVVSEVRGSIESLGLRVPFGGGIGGVRNGRGSGVSHVSVGAGAGSKHQSSFFFEAQLTEFEIWLEYGVRREREREMNDRRRMLLKRRSVELGVEGDGGVGASGAAVALSEVSSGSGHGAADGIEDGVDVSSESRIRSRAASGNTTATHDMVVVVTGAESRDEGHHDGIGPDDPSFDLGGGFGGRRHRRHHQLRNRTRGANANRGSANPRVVLMEEHHPTQLPMLLQVLLSQTHRKRALLLLLRYLQLGDRAINLALAVGIFPYVLKLLQSHAKDLRDVLVSIWAHVVAFDKSAQADLVRERGHEYFLSVLNLWRRRVIDGAIGLRHQLPLSIELRSQCCFVLAHIMRKFEEGQLAILSSSSVGGGHGGHGGHGVGGAAGGGHHQILQVVRFYLDRKHHENDHRFRQWIVLMLSQLVFRNEEAQFRAFQATIQDFLLEFLNDQEMGADLRATIVYALGTFVNMLSMVKRKPDLVVENEVKMGLALVDNIFDGSPLVRREILYALAAFVVAYSEKIDPQVFEALFEKAKKERRRLRDILRRRSGIVRAARSPSSTPPPSPSDDDVEGEQGPVDLSSSSAARDPSERPLRPLLAVDDEDDAPPVFADPPAFRRPTGPVAVSGRPVARGTRGRAGAGDADPLPMRPRRGRDINLHLRGDPGSAQTRPRQRQPQQEQREQPQDPYFDEPMDDPQKALERDRQTSAFAMDLCRVLCMMTYDPFEKVSDLAWRILCNLETHLGLGANRPRGSRRRRAASPEDEDTSRGHGHIGVGSTLPVPGFGPTPMQRHRSSPNFRSLVRNSSRAKTELWNRMPHSTFLEYASSLFLKRSENLKKRDVELILRQQHVQESLLAEASMLMQTAGSQRLESERLFFGNEIDPVRQMRLHSSRRLLLCRDDFDKMTLWHYQRGKEIDAFHTYHHARGRITDFTLLNEKYFNDLLLVATSSGSVCVYEKYATPISRRLITSFIAVPEANIEETGDGVGIIVNWQQQNGCLIVGGDVGTLKIWDLTKEVCSASIKTKVRTCVTCMASDPSGGGQVFVAGTGNHALVFVDQRRPRVSKRIFKEDWNPTIPASGTLSKKKRHRSRHHSVSAPSLYVDLFIQRVDSNLVFAADNDGVVEMWDIRRPSEPIHRIETKTQNMTSFAVHRFCPIFAVGSPAKCVKVFNFNGDSIGSICFHEGLLGRRIGPVSALCFHPFRKKLAVACTDNVISLYE